MATDINPWSAEHWDPIAQSNYIRKYGMARAVARAKDAGTTVHGAPPAPKYDHAKHKKQVLTVMKRRNALRQAAATTLSARFDLGFIQVDNPFLIDQEIDIILNPGDISFPVHYRVGLSARDVPFGNVVPIWPDPILLGVDSTAPTVEATIPQTDFDLGVEEAVQFSDTLGLTVNMALGLLERATFGDERDIFDVNMLLGYDANNDIQINTENIPAAPSLGINEAAAINLERDINASALLGLTETAAVALIYDISASFDLGVDQTEVFELEQGLTTSMDLGVDESTLVGVDAELTASMDLGVDQTTHLDAALEAIAAGLGVDVTAVADVLANIISNHSLGVTETASVSLESDLVASESLGVTQTLPVYGLDTERQPQVSDIHVGVDMFAQPYIEYPIGPYSPSLGVDVAATVIRETYQSASPALGVDVNTGGGVQALVRKLYGSFIVAQTGSTSVNSFSAPVGQESDSRYIVLVISYQRGAGVGNLTQTNIGSVANGIFVKRVSYGGVAQTEIWYAKVTTGTSVTIEYLLTDGAGNPVDMTSTCAVYTIMSAASDTVYLMDSDSDSQSGTTSAVTPMMDTEKDTGFVVAGTIHSSSSGVTTGPAQLTNDATSAERQFWSGVDTLNRDSFEIDVTASQSKLIAAASFSAFQRVDVGTTLDLGIAESAILSRTQQNLSSSPTLGFDVAARLDSAFGASPALGITQASNLIVLQNLSASPSLGISEAAAVQLQRNLTAAPGLGASMSASVQALSTPLVKTYKGFNNANNVAQTTWSFAGQAIGTASSDRWVFVLWAAHNSAARTISSITIGGVTAFIETVSGTSNQTTGMCGIASANVPSGTTATIAFTFSGAFAAATTNGVGFDYYTVVGPLNQVATDQLNSNVATTPISKTFSVPDGGVAFAVGVPQNINKNITGDFTIDDNFATQYVGGLTIGSASVAQNTGSAVNKTVNYNSMSSGGACPIVGRCYAHT